jgi:DNA replication protein DnaC
MLRHPTIEGLRSLRLPAMAEGLLEQQSQPDYATMSFDERLGLLVDREILQRHNRRLERVLKVAKLRSGAVVEDVDFSAARGLDKTTFHSLVSSTWVANHHNVMIVGPTGVGKTFIACALGHSAIRNGDRSLYVRVPRMLDELVVARADGRLSRLMATFAKVDVLILDDLLLRPLNDDQAADLLEVIEDRRGRTVIVTSQLPISHWHEGLGEATIADAILDRLLQRTHRIELKGKSRRRSDPTNNDLSSAPE